MLLQKDFSQKRGYALVSSFFILFFLTYLFPTFVFAQVPKNENIELFKSEINIEKDGKTTIKETIQYDFGSNRKHGIYRDIPLSYKTSTGKEQDLHMIIQSVVDEHSKELPYEESREGNNFRIKIGDPSKFISGLHTYVITYETYFALGYFEKADELYWNVTGNNWLVPIQKLEANITLPEGVLEKDLIESCYYGQVGSTQKCNDFTQKTPGQLKLQYVKILEPGEGVTLALGFPKGIVLEPPFYARTLFFIKNNPIIFLPFFVFGIMFSLWYRTGKDPKGTGVIVAEYDVPENLTALEVAALFQNSIQAKDISASLISLAINGYIRIEEVSQEGIISDLFKKKEYIFYRLSKEAPKSEAEAYLLKSLFSPKPKGKLLFFKNSEETVVPLESVKLSELKNIFYKNIPVIEQKTFESLVQKGFYLKSPKDAMKNYTIGIVIPIVAVIFLGSWWGGISIVSIVVSTIIYVIFVYLIPKKTEAGVLIKEKLLGLKEYLQIAEKNRLEFHNAPEKSPVLFERLLPAAMILGVSKIWSKEFADVSFESSNWYVASTGSRFASADDFTSSLQSFLGASSTSLNASPGGSGGGGSSGGGGGGGGGGSW